MSSPARQSSGLCGISSPPTYRCCAAVSVLCSCSSSFTPFVVFHLVLRSEDDLHSDLQPDRQMTCFSELDATGGTGVRNGCRSHRSEKHSSEAVFLHILNTWKLYEQTFYPLAAMRSGVRSPYAPPITLQVRTQILACFHVGQK